MEIDNELKKELVQLITNFRESVPVYRIRHLTSIEQEDSAKHLASKFMKFDSSELLAPRLCVRRGINTTVFDLPVGVKMRIYNNSGAMVIKRNMRPLEHIFGERADLERLKHYTIEEIKRLDLERWRSDFEDVQFERLWKIKAGAITLDNRRVPEVLCRVVGAFRRFISKIPVYGRASIFVKLATNRIIEAAGIDWRLIEKEAMDEVKIIDPDAAAGTILRELASFLPNKVITSKIYKPELFSLGYISLPKSRYQKYMQPAYLATFKSTGLTTLNRGIVINASTDIYEPLSLTPAPPPRTQRTDQEMYTNNCKKEG
jgi:hypothetical protein